MAWIEDEAARQAAEYSDDPATALAESCLRAGYRRGLLEAARLASKWRNTALLIKELRALANARADSGQGD